MRGRRYVDREGPIHFDVNLRKLSYINLTKPYIVRISMLRPFRILDSMPQLSERSFLIVAQLFDINFLDGIIYGNEGLCQYQCER